MAFEISQRGEVRVVEVIITQTPTLAGRMFGKSKGNAVGINFDLDVADLNMIKGIIEKHTDACPLDAARCEKHEIPG